MRYLRHLFRLPPHPSHSRAILPLQYRFHCREPPKCRSHGPQDARGGVVIEEEQEGTAQAERTGELGGEEDKVERWFEDVAAVSWVSCVPRESGKGTHYTPAKASLKAATSEVMYWSTPSRGTR